MSSKKEWKEYAKELDREAAKYESAAKTAPRPILKTWAKGVAEMFRAGRDAANENARRR